MAGRGTFVRIGLMTPVLVLALGIYFHFKKADEKQAKLEAAYEQYDTRRDKELQAETWLNRSFRSFERGQFEQAAEQREKSESVGATSVLVKLADAYAEGEKTPKSIDEAERIYQGIGGSRYSFWVSKTAQKLTRSGDKATRERGIKLLKSAVDLGDQKATEILARYYEHGNFVDKSYEQSRSLYQKLGDGEYRKFLTRHGNRLVRSISRKDREMGYGYLIQAVDLGEERAKLFVSWCLMHGNGVESDRDGALAILKELESSADEKLRFEVGQLYLTREFKYQNDLGVEVMEALVDKGYVDASNELANFYYGSSWRDSDYELAAQYYLQSENLTPDEKVRLADLYRVGVGVEQDLDRSLTLYKEATQNFAHTRAHLSLGHMYRLGLGVDVELEAALEHYNKAGRFENQDATYYIGRIYELGLGGQPDLTEAAYYYEKAIEREQPEAFAALARMYEQGRGVEVSKSRAFDLMRKSGMLGSTAGRLGMSEYYSRGIGCEPSEKISAQWRSKLDENPLAFE